MVQRDDDPRFQNDFPSMIDIAFSLFPRRKTQFLNTVTSVYLYFIFFWLCAFVADLVMKEAGSKDIMIRNWVGERHIVPLVKEILDREKELIGDKRSLIMKYIEEEQPDSQV